MVRILLYNGLLLLVAAYAMTRGGWAERTAALVLLIGSLATRAAYSPLASRFGDVELTVLAVDLLVLVGFTAVALKSDRFWPLWLAALQLIGVLVHIARLSDASMMRTGYAFLLAIWAYPMLALIAFATWSYRRRGGSMRRMSGS